MSSLISDVLSYGFVKTYRVAATIRTYAATSLDPRVPLQPTSVIGSNPIKLPSIEDHADTEALEKVRDSWLYALSKPFHVSALGRDGDPIIRHLRIEQIGDERKSLAAEVMLSRHPIPPSYTFSLPVKTQDTLAQRKNILSSLVPFREARDMLLRLEDKLELPIASVRVNSWRIDA